MNLLDPRPTVRVAVRCREARAQLRPPLGFIASVEGPRIERAERVAADPVIVLEDEAQVRFEREVRTDVDPAECVGIVAIEGLSVATVVARLQTDVVRAGFVAVLRRPNQEL